MQTAPLSGTNTVSMQVTYTDRLVDLVVRASTLRPYDPGFDSRLRHGDLSGSSHTSDSKIGTQVLISCQAPGVTGSALRLVGPVSVYID